MEPIEEIQVGVSLHVETASTIWADTAVTLSTRAFTLLITDLIEESVRRGMKAGAEMAMEMIQGQEQEREEEQTESTEGFAGFLGDG